MNNEIIKIIGKNKGPKSMILVGVHGNERCGIEALKKLKPFLKIEKGTVFVGYGNPLAIRKNIRYIEADLNRMFKSNKFLSTNEKNSYEYKRSQFIKKYLDKSDALLDIHASTTLKSQPFIICEKNAIKIANSLPANFVVSGFDKIQPGGTDYYMNKAGKVGICIECGYLKSKKSIQIAEESILNFLISRKHISGKTRNRKQFLAKIYEQYYTKTSNFVLTKKFKDFEKIKKGQIIGFDKKRKVVTKKDSFILFAKNKNKVNKEAFLLGEYIKKT